MPTPQRLGKYQILRKLGAGAMGVVYEGFDPLIERSVALKVIRQDDLGATEAGELRARLKREAQAAGRLAHPGIVAVYEYGEDSGGQGAFIAMEMVRGRELKTVLDDGARFTPPEAVRLMRAVLAALQHAHERGVVHRDIKPSNVFLQNDGEIKVADFGVARLESSELTQTGAMIGTPSYMSPEQLLGQPVDGRSDLFSCGIVLYQLLTGEKPFTGSVTTVMHKLLHEQAAPPSTIDTTLIPRWDSVLERALAKQPADRYQSAAEFSRAIGQALADMPQEDDATVVMARPRAVAPGSAATLGSGTRRTLATVTSPQAVPPAVAAPVVRDPAPRRPTTAIATAVAALLATAGGGVWWLTRDADVPPSPVAVLPPPAAAPVAAPPPVAAPIAVEPAAALPAVEPTPPPTAASPAAAAPPRTSAASPVAVPRPTPPPPAAPRPAPPPPATTTVPAPPKPPDPWQLARSRVETAVPLSSGQALRLLLDVRSADDREALADFDRMLGALPSHNAVAFGVRDGHLRWRVQSKAPDVGAASRLALQRCNEGLPVPCRVVQRDGEFSGSAFVEATAPLGEVDVATVRSTAMRAVANAVKAWREQQAVATAPVTPPVSPPPPPPPPAPAPAPAPKPPAAPTPPPAPPTQTPTTTPAPPPVVATAPAPKPATTEPTAGGDWAKAQAALLASPGPGSFADALVVMLGAQSEADVNALRRFGSAMKRLRWISALAMGQNRNGFIVYGYTSGWSKEAWAQERALEECARGSNSPCSVVFVNGDARNPQLAALAAKLAQRPQGDVRRVFIESTKQTLAKGAGL